jgi:hypothetical protein
MYTMKRIGGDLEISKQYIQIENGKVIANNWMQEKINKKGMTVKGHSGNNKFQYTRKFKSNIKSKGKSKGKIKRKGSSVVTNTRRHRAQRILTMG